MGSEMGGEGEGEGPSKVNFDGKGTKGVKGEG